MARGWHILRDGDTLTLARQVPARFDCVARTTLPTGAPLRYAQQIRQDLWRALRNVRGFSPVVRLSARSDGWEVEAGGRVVGATVGLEARVLAVLESPRLRTRWIAQAGRREANT